VTAILDTRAPAEVGRHARLDLTFGVRHGRSVLEQQYAEPPLRIGGCFNSRDQPHTAHAIIASSAPGIFRGDRFEQTIRIRQGASVHLASQSALQVHPSLSDTPAAIRSRFIVEAGGELRCEWHPTVPFANAALDQRIDIDVAEGARMVWSDALMAGREGRGERWRFQSVEHELRLNRVDRLVYLERYRIGAPGGCAHRWIADESAYFGTILRIGSGAVPERAEAVQRALERPAVYGAADIIDHEVLLVRIASASGVAFHAARAAATALLTQRSW
jgi:urease accessory protein